MKGLLALGALLLGSLVAEPIGAQTRTPATTVPRRTQAPAVARSGAHPVSDGIVASDDLRGHFGIDAAARLMRSPNADERLRGFERAAATRSRAGLALLERAVRTNGPGALDPRMPDEGLARKDPRALLVVVQSLAGWTEDESARAALDEIVRAPDEAFAARPAASPSADPAADDATGGELVTLAREEAAVALATSGNALALERLVTAARSGGAGQSAALVALSINPPSEPFALGGVALATAATVALAGHIGDLRTLDSILGIVHASDPALRAAALLALGEAGDTRTAELCRAALHDDDARVKTAAAAALALLATPDAASAVEALVMDDATAAEGLRIAEHVQSDGIVRAAAARAAASADRSIRSAALETLGRQASPLAVRALAALVAIPSVAGDAAYALARSPSAGALAALEGLAIAPELRRLVARAYFVRRFRRGERSTHLDALLGALTDSPAPLDRAVGTQALVALGERSLDAALSDRDARVRRAAAMGALATQSMTDPKIMARAETETDEATRQVLALAWTKSAGASARVPTKELVARAVAGGPDAPAAAFALGGRLEDGAGTVLDALLHSRDPLLRALTARGLGASAAPDAAARLLSALASEGDASVRRALVAGLSPPHRSGIPEVRSALLLASRLDPDRVVRWNASQALRGDSDAAGHPPSSGFTAGGAEDVAWLRLTPADDAPTVVRGVTAVLATSNGAAIPIVFDDEGYALVPGVSPGDARLRLAPQLPPYSAPLP